MKIAPIAKSASRILIVDRDSMSGDLLANALVRDRRCDAASIASTDLSEAMTGPGVELVIIAADLNAEPRSGFDLAYRVSRAHPETSIVILLNSSSHDAVISAFRSGARGVFSRQQSMSEFLDCVEHVSKGCIWAGPEETNTLLDAFKSIPAPNPVTAMDTPTLTTRELQVVQMAATGKTNKVIASELSLSEHTVKNYLFRAFEKLGVSSRVELLFYLTIRGHSLPNTVPDPAENPAE